MKSGKYLRAPVIALIIISLILGTTSFAAAAAKPKLSAQQLSIRAGSTSQLRVKNTDKKIRWSTSDKKIATVKSAGKTKAKVSAKKTGTCVITARVSKKYTLKCKVKVLAKKQSNSQPALKTIEYSNLTDEYSRGILSDLLAENGIEASRIDALMSRIDGFNDSVRSEWLTDGFEIISLDKTKYDVYDMQDEYTAKNGTFPGYNCRITVYSLLGNFLTVGADQPETQGEDLLFTDLATIAADPTVLFGDGTAKFCALFAPIDAADSTRTEDQVQALQKGWNSRGITFASSKAHLICVVFHDQFSDTDTTLSLGHAGVFLPAEDDTLYFFEKVAFQEPYRLLKFQNRTELSDYLMEKYDTAWGQDTTRPFVMENDALMDGFRQNPLED